jgi:hypothetical protein
MIPVTVEHILTFHIKKILCKHCRFWQHVRILLSSKWPNSGLLFWQTKVLLLNHGYVTTCAKTSLPTLLSNSTTSTYTSPQVHYKSSACMLWFQSYWSHRDDELCPSNVTSARKFIVVYGMTNSDFFQVNPIPNQYDV